MSSCAPQPPPSLNRTALCSPEPFPVELRGKTKTPWAGLWRHSFCAQSCSITSEAPLALQPWGRCSVPFQGVGEGLQPLSGFCTNVVPGTGAPTDSGLLCIPSLCVSDSAVMTVTYASEHNQGTLYLSLCLKSSQFPPNKTSEMIHLPKTLWPWPCARTCLGTGPDRPDQAAQPSVGGSLVFGRAHDHSGQGWRSQ